MSLLMLKFVKNLYKEIIEFDNYDDVVMSGRQRVNKGSKILITT